MDYQEELYQAWHLVIKCSNILCTRWHDSFAVAFYILSLWLDQRVASLPFLEKKRSLQVSDLSCINTMINSLFPLVCTNTGDCSPVRRLNCLNPASSLLCANRWARAVGLSLLVKGSASSGLALDILVRYKNDMRHWQLSQPFFYRTEILVTKTARCLVPLYS